MGRVTRSADRGASLVEAMVVVFLLTIIMGLTTTTFIAGLRTTSRSAAQQDNTTTLRAALDSMTKHIRTAVTPSIGTLPPPADPPPAFDVATPDAITFYAYVNTAQADGTYLGPSKMRYYVLTTPECGTCLYEEITHAAAGGPPYTWPGPPASSRVLARGLLSPQPRAVFTFLQGSDVTGLSAPTAYASAVANPATQTLVAGAGGALAELERKRIVGVEIALTADRPNPIDVPRTTMIDRVTIPNAMVER